MDWQRLDRKATEDLIQKAGSASVLFSPQTSEARRASLSFLDNFAIYRLTNYAALPIISLDYLVNENKTDNNSVIYLDGSKNCILQAIRNDNFSITEENIVSYVSFFFKNAPDPEGDIYIIEDLDDLVFFDLLEAEQQNKLRASFSEPEIRRLDDGRFEIQACMVYQGSLVTATTSILGDGNINVSSISMMIHSTPAYHKVDN
jgi:hypothetical protein|tara:strand:- start:425776 stop:426384 length:609 start_codon:yes stop_codon:yes gene_type:complete